MIGTPYRSRSRRTLWRFAMLMMMIRWTQGFCCAVFLQPPSRASVMGISSRIHLFLDTLSYLQACQCPFQILHRSLSAIGPRPAAQSESSLHESPGATEQKVPGVSRYFPMHTRPSAQSESLKHLSPTPWGCDVDPRPCGATNTADVEAVAIVAIELKAAVVRLY